MERGEAPESWRVANGILTMLLLAGLYYAVVHTMFETGDRPYRAMRAKAAELRGRGYTPDQIMADPDEATLYAAYDKKRLWWGIWGLLQSLVWPIPLVPLLAWGSGYGDKEAGLARWAVDSLIVITGREPTGRQAVDAEPNITDEAGSYLNSPEVRTGIQTLQDEYPSLHASELAEQLVRGSLAWDDLEDHLGKVFSQSDAAYIADRYRGILAASAPLPDVEDLMPNDDSGRDAVKERGAALIHDIGLPREELSGLMYSAQQGVSFSKWWEREKAIYVIGKNTEAMKQVTAFYETMTAMYRARIDAAAAVRQFKGEDRDPTAEAREKQLVGLGHEERVLEHQVRIKELQTKLQPPAKPDWKVEYQRSGERAIEISKSFSEFQLKMREEKYRKEQEILASNMSDIEKGRMLAEHETFHTEMMEAMAKDMARRGYTE